MCIYQLFAGESEVLGSEKFAMISHNKDSEFISLVKTFKDP